jgi:nitrogenase molybdenum-iron protein NifN
MGTVIKGAASDKACAVNPLKMSSTIGASLAFLGMERCLPLLHGSQGCTAFGLVLFVRHFRETIPLQTTAMGEVTTILGGLDNLEQALVNIHKRADPALIGVCTTGLTETKGDDVAGYLKVIRNKHPQLESMEVVLVPAPDYVGAFQDGWARAVQCMIEQLAVPCKAKSSWQVNILPGCHLTPGDIEELRETVEAYGLLPIILPDLSGSLDGHVPETFLPTTLGGTPLEQVRRMGASALTIAVGEQMRPAAEALARITGVPYRLFDRLTGLAPCDALHALLADISATDAPLKFRRQRSQLQDAMLDGHFYFGGRTVSIAAEPDLLFALSNFFHDMGARIGAAVTSTNSPVLTHVPCAEVRVGDLEDWEQCAVGSDLLVAHSHGRQAAARLGIPFYRAGLPMFDRLGAAQKTSIGYRGTRNLIFEVGNVFIESQHEPACPVDAEVGTLGCAGGCSHTDAAAVPCH